MHCNVGLRYLFRQRKCVKILENCQIEVLRQGESCQIEVYSRGKSVRLRCCNKRKVSQWGIESKYKSIGLKYVHVPKCSVTVTVGKGQLCRSCSGNGKNGCFVHILSNKYSHLLVSVRFYRSVSLNLNSLSRPICVCFKSTHIFDGQINVQLHYLAGISIFWKCIGSPHKDKYFTQSHTSPHR